MQRSLLSLFLLILSLQLTAVPVSPVSELPNTTSEPEKSITLDDIRDLKDKALSEKLGRKLTFKEGIAFSMVRGKLKRDQKRAEKRKAAAGGTTVAEVGLWASLVGLAAVVLAIIIGSSVGALWSLALIALLLGVILGAMGMNKFKENDPEKHKKSKLAFWLGLIPLTLGAIFVVIALIALANLFD